MAERKSPDASLARAAQSFADFASGPMAATTAGIEQAVDRSFTAVANSIARAAEIGRTSMGNLTAAILADFDRIAAREFIAKPLESLVGSVAGAILPLAGARAAGGPVAAGQSYLVGEAGPELFTPAGNGAITSNATLASARPQVVVNITTPDAQSFLKSRSQVAAMLAKAVGQGQRNL
jgi:phage-related minor tail protein